MTTTHTILIVDDEPNLRTTLALILQREGYSVSTAASADEALQFLQAGAYDLAFLDIRMPDKDGLVLLTEIREFFSDMPVVLLTAYASLESAVEAVRRDASDYLIKPIDPPQILNCVRRILARQEQPRRRREIFNEMQGLLSELSEIENTDPSQPARNDLSTVINPSRYLQRGKFKLDLHARQMTVNGKTISLTPITFDYLVTLVRHSPEPVPYQALVMESQGFEPTLLEAKEVTRWRVHELRKAIERDSRNPEFIITVRGVGYRLIT